jgi:hypothetical protein
MSTLSLRLMLLASLLLVAGCGGKGAYPVEGKIVYPDGTVATDLGGHMVTLESAELHVSANGEVQPDGTFKLGMFEPDDGALPGKYKASITRLLPIGDVRPQPDVIDPKFNSLETSGLEVTIEPKENSLTLTVERAKGKQ